MRAYRLFAIALTLFLSSCGKEASRGGGGDPVKPPVENVTVEAQLILFGAPWCKNCKHDFPEIQQLLNQKGEAFSRQIQMTLYVTTGASSFDKPSQEIADQYRDFLKLNAEAKMDPWRWTTFRSYIKGPMELPAAVVLDSDGNVLKLFPAGTTTFVPGDIISYLSSQVAGGR